VKKLEIVIPAQAGILKRNRTKIPAWAGMTVVGTLTPNNKLEVVMRKRLFQLLLLLILTAGGLISSGCEKDGKIRIVNRTSFPLHAVVMDVAYTIAPDGVKTIDVTTGTQTPFSGDVGKYVQVSLLGETFQIWDDYLNHYVDSTYVWVNAGKTTGVYTLPNRASVKVKNQSGQKIKRVIIQRNTTLTSNTDTYDIDLPSGSEWFKPIPFATEENSFYLIVQVVYDDDTSEIFGNEQTIMGLDEQFLIDLLPPLKQPDS